MMALSPMKRRCLILSSINRSIRTNGTASGLKTGCCAIIFFVMNANILVSVIVPMYNASRYLSTCLDSLASATFRDHMQVILVNDGSTDETAALAGSYVDRFPDLFQLVEKQNGGLSDARNFGLPYVKGTYLAFLDSDDWIEPDLYERLYQTIENEGADVCVCDLEYWFEDPSKRFVMKGLSQWQADTVQKKALLSPMFAWNKLYRAELFTADNGYRYPLHTWYEDIPVTTLLFAKAERIAYLPECGIHYRQHDDSIMGSVHDKRVKDIFGVLELVRKEFRDAGLYDTYHEELEYLHIEHLCLYGMFRFIRSDWSDECAAKAGDVMKKEFPDWKHNCYIRNLGWKNRMFLACYNEKTAALFNRRIRG